MLNKNSKNILFVLPVFVLALGVYFSGGYLQSKSEEKLSLAKEEVKVENKPEVQVEQKKKIVVDRWQVPNDVKAVKSTYRFPSVRNVRAGLIVELNNREVYWAQNATKSVPIASLTKCLTVLTVLETIKNNPKYSLSDEVKISKSAMVTSSSVFLRKYPKDTVSVKELLVTAMVKSANDSCELLAEHFGNGDPKRFISLMNEQAKALGLPNTQMSNSHGLPFSRSNPKLDNHSSMEDLLNIVRKLIKDYPMVLEWTSIRSLSYPKGSPKAVKLNNTNPLLAVKGVNGFKTGFTLNAGWCQILTIKRNGKFYFLVVTGCPSKNTRNVVMRELMNWALKVP